MGLGIYFRLILEKWKMIQNFLINKKIYEIMQVPVKYRVGFAQL